RSRRPGDLSLSEVPPLRPPCSPTRRTGGRGTAPGYRNSWTRPLPAGTPPGTSNHEQHHHKSANRTDDVRLHVALPHRGPDSRNGGSKQAVALGIEGPPKPLLRISPWFRAFGVSHDRLPLSGFRNGRFRRKPVRIGCRREQSLHGTQKGPRGALEVDAVILSRAWTLSFLAPTWKQEANDLDQLVVLAAMTASIVALRLVGLVWQKISDPGGGRRDRFTDYPQNIGAKFALPRPPKELVGRKRELKALLARL